jgi:hypothetical protein
VTAAKAARLIWIHGGRNIDPRTAAYFVRAVPTQAPMPAKPQEGQVTSEE